MITTLFYKYFPRFMVGMCWLHTDATGRTHYRLITGPIVVQQNSKFILAEVEFLNIFSGVFLPKVLRTYTAHKLQ